MIGKIASVLVVLGSLFILILGFILPHLSWMIGLGIVLIPSALMGVLEFFVGDEKSANRHFHLHHRHG